MPLTAVLVLLPVMGLALNGTSSVLYGTVADFVDPERRSRAFGLFYTLGVGASAFAPFLLGMLSDASSVEVTLLLLTGWILLTLPPTFLLRGPLASVHEALPQTP